MTIGTKTRIETLPLTCRGRYMGESYEKNGQPFLALKDGSKDYLVGAKDTEILEENGIPITLGELRDRKPKIRRLEGFLEGISPE